MKFIYILPDELEDYVQNKAAEGDILMSFSVKGGIVKEYIYICTKNNIGKNIKPYWVTLRSLVIK
jgi:hypothetical protein